MKPLSPTRNLSVPRHAPHSLPPRHIYFLSSFFTTIFAILFAVPAYGLTVRQLRSAAQPRHTSNRSFPQLNLHKARVRRTTRGHVQTALPDARREPCLVYFSTRTRIRLSSNVYQAFARICFIILIEHPRSGLRLIDPAGPA